MSEVDEIFQQLKKPFPADEIQWRVQAMNSQKTGGYVLAYITSRAVMDRLDEVVGPQNWWDEYIEFYDGVKCALTIALPDGQTITRQDAAPQTQIESIKGGVSDALKRAAVKFGVGRYLYHLDDNWVDFNTNGNGVRAGKDDNGNVLYFRPPELPSFALPDRDTTQESKPTREELDVDMTQSAQKLMWKAENEGVNVNPSAIEGSGENGRILKDDMEQHIRELKGETAEENYGYNVPEELWRTFHSLGKEVYEDLEPQVYDDAVGSWDEKRKQLLALDRINKESSKELTEDEMDWMIGKIRDKKKRLERELEVKNNPKF